jgi:hypothetical protein
MSEVHEIYIRRAKALADLSFCEHRDRLVRDGYKLPENHDEVRIEMVERDWPNHIDAARAIRISDEAAGYKPTKPDKQTSKTK